ncbi:fibronectin type III domain-containing protein [Streptomyces sp. NRRL S-87]|uniref:fibronectin type III domain-containing protein n=1 Tax=Streptomyces sp. NRRL S-87 TaxID=1463920 RepID=UPI00099B3344|nr:fibronectin type III domain-containing protein [Streptomyces sp. NRRL S-87]
MRRTVGPVLVLCCLLCSVPLTACGGPGADTDPPPSPAGLTAESGSATSAHVMWEAADPRAGVTAYQVFRDGVLVRELPAERTMVDVDGLSPATRYAFTVRARDAAGNLSDPTGAARVTTAARAARDVRAPGAPARLTARAEDGRTVHLVWSAARDDTGVTAYDVYQGGVRVHTAGGRETGTRLTGLRPHTAYAFTVRARDAAENSSPDSPAARLTTPAAPDTGGTVPVDFLATAAPGTVELSWTWPDPAHRPRAYELWVNGRPTTVVQWGADAVPVGRTVQRLDATGPGGTVWTVKLRARLPDGGWGGFSPERSVTLVSAGSN